MNVNTFYICDNFPMPPARALAWKSGEITPKDFARRLREERPDEIVIDLAVRPGEGRQIVEWIRSRKSSRDIPISFVNGVLKPRSPAAERTIAQKLGIGDVTTVGVIDGPRDYASVLGVDAEEDPPRPRQVTVWFLESEEELFPAIRRIRVLAAQTRLWIAWRKGTGFSLRNMREAMLDAGLVDYKICSLGPRWSAMAWTRRKV